MTLPGHKFTKLVTLVNLEGHVKIILEQSSDMQNFNGLTKFIIILFIENQIFISFCDRSIVLTGCKKI